MAKRYIKIMFAIILMIAMGFPAVQASGNAKIIDSALTPTQSSTEVDVTFSLAKDFLTKYYYTINLGTAGKEESSFLDSPIFDTELTKYMKQKVNTEQYVITAVNGEKENYILNFTILNSKVTDEKVFLSVTSEATYNYEGLIIESGFGEVSNMIFEKTDFGYVLIDWHMPYEYYDEYVRGYLEKDTQLNAFSTTKHMEYASIQNELHEKIVNSLSKDYQIDENLLEVKAADKNISTRSTLYTLNKSNIISYARNNIKAYPSSGNGVVPYYDFSSIPGNYDCTNFVSHALLAGGAVIYDTNNSGISPTGWYFRNISNRSSSWSGVPNLYSFIVNNYIKGPAGTSIIYRTFNWYLPNHPYVLGDILQFYQSGSYNNWRHSTIITEFYETSQPNVVGALVTGRTAVGQYNNNDKAELLYPGDAKRVIKLSGYYN